MYGVKKKGAYWVLNERDHLEKCEWEENIKTDLQEIRSGTWTTLIWLRIGTSGWLL